jgi:hypothetical protein
MKTKNFLLTGALLIVALFSVNGVMAQPSAYGGNRVSSDAVTVNLKFVPIQSIQVNPNQNTIDFVFDSPTDYTNGLAAGEKTQTQTDHLTVYHSGPFNVKVKSSGFVNNGETLAETNHVNIRPKIGTNSEVTTAEVTYKEVSLAATSGADFISSPIGGMGFTFDVTYDHVGDITKYINHNFNSTEKTYVATVTYEIFSN